MMNEINENMNIVELNDDELEGVSGGTKIQATGNVNVRTGPGLDYRSIGTLSKGDKVTYEGSSKKDNRGVRWYCIKFHGGSGWISSKYSKKI